MDRQEHEFGVGGLPQQKIRQPLFARGADDEIGIGNVGRAKARGERVGVDRGGIEPTRRRLARQAARRFDDLLPGAVVEGDDEAEPAIGPRQPLGFVKQRDDVGGRPARWPITRTRTSLLCRSARSLRM